MADLNKLLLSGRSVGDCEMRTNKNGDPIAKFRIASNKRNGEALFIDVVVFGRQAETAEKYIVKGKQLIVEGRLDISQWEKDGVRQSKPELICTEFNFFGSKGDSQEDRPLTQHEVLDRAKDVVIDDFDDKPISLEDIPF